MKKFLAALMLIFCLGSAIGCTSSTSLGPCVGINEGDRDPKLHYRVDTGNVIVVALDELYCPDRVK